MNSSLPKYIHAENWIKEAIKHKEITEKLPGERVLASQLGISYMTIRKAIDNLVEQGYLYRIPTKGTYVADRSKNTRKETHNIGYFLDSSIKDGLTSPYYSLIFNALEKEAAKRGYSLIYFSNISEENSVQKMKKIDGAIVSCFPRIENVIQEIKRLVPVVLIDNASFDKSIPSIIIDNFNAVADSVNYLCSLGHERIGFITGLEDSDVGNNRLAGYRYGLKSRGIHENPEYIFKGDYTYETGKEGLRHLLSLDNAPTAIMCANDSMALGAMKEANRLGMSVPDDVSIVGFDDITVASQINPPLTTVAAPIDKIAALSVDMIHALINNIELEKEHVALKATTKVRSSCTYPREDLDLRITA